MVARTVTAGVSRTASSTIPLSYRDNSAAFESERLSFVAQRSAIVRLEWQRSHDHDVVYSGRSIFAQPENSLHPLDMRFPKCPDINRSFSSISFFSRLCGLAR